MYVGNRGWWMSRKDYAFYSSTTNAEVISDSCKFYSNSANTTCTFEALSKGTYALLINGTIEIQTTSEAKVLKTISVGATWDAYCMVKLD